MVSIPKHPADIDPITGTEWNIAANAIENGLPTFDVIAEPAPGTGDDRNTFTPHRSSTVNQGHPNTARPYYWRTDNWRSVNIQAITFFVNTHSAGGSDLTRFSLYDTANNLPNALVHDFGSVDISGGAGEYEITGLDIDLPAGQYWLRWVTDVATLVVKGQLTVGFTSYNTGGTRCYRASAGNGPGLAAPATAETVDNQLNVSTQNLISYRGSWI